MDIVKLAAIGAIAYFIMRSPAASTPPASGANPPAVTPPTTTPTPPAGATGDPAPVAAARRELAKIVRTTGPVTVVEYTAVMWPDASLGVPEPGMFYAQVVTPGYKVVLSAAGQNWEFHTNADGSRCKFVNPLGTGAKTQPGVILRQDREIYGGTGL